MERSRLLNILLVLLILIAALALAQMLWQLLSGFADIILLFILGWILSFVLDPVVDDLCEDPIPDVIVRAATPLLGPRRARRLSEWCLSRTPAVIVVYLGLLVLVIVIVALFVPPTVVQLTQIASRLPDYMDRAPQAGFWVQNQLARIGIRVNIENAIQGAVTALEGTATLFVQNALGIFTSLITFLANVFIVLVLSFYISLDGSRVRHRLLSMVPESFQREANYLSVSVNRTFGGFIRGQFLQAFLIAVGTAVAMQLAGLNFIMAASLFAFLFMLIPLVGPVLALLPPLVIALFQVPDTTIWLLIALFLYQSVIVNILMPRVFSKALGLHPLLVLAAILIGIKVGGFWGAFFGIPFASVIWAMGEYFVEKWQRSELEKAQIAAELAAQQTAAQPATAPEPPQQQGRAR